MGKYFDIIKESSLIAVAGHLSPDGDSVGACFAVAYALSKLGKKVVVLLEELESRYCVIPGSEFIHNGSAENLDPDVFIALDCGDKERLGKFGKIFDKARFTFCIDHHVSNLGFADYNHIEPDASSTCEIVYKLMIRYVEMDFNIASALYAGMVYDTGGFCHASTGSGTLEIASRLMEFKIPFSEIYNEIMKAHSVNEVCGLKTAIENIVINQDKRFAYSVVSLADIESAGITHKDFEGIAEYLLNIRGIRLSFFACEKPGGFVRFSIRSKDIDVSKIAAKLGGGGHFNAAGASVGASCAEAVAMVLHEMEEHL